MALDISCSKLHATMLTELVLCFLSCKAGEEDHRQWRYHQHQGIRSAVVRYRGGFHRSQIPVAASPVGPGIAVEHFAPHAPTRCSHPIVRTRYRGEVADHQQRCMGSLALA